MASTKKRPSGWMRRKQQDIQRLKDKRAGDLETNIKGYNAKIARTSEQAKKFCDDRRRLDDFLQRKRDKEALKDLW